MAHDNEILATVQHGAMRELLPEDPRLRIDHLCIGSYLDTSTSIAPITSTPSGGWISGGGTQTSRFRRYDLGFAVVNTGNIPMRVQMVLVKVDSDGYANDTRHVWGDVSPGEKKRLWANLGLMKRSELGAYMIKEFGIAIPAAGVAPYVASTSPNRNVSDLFARSVDTLRTNTVMDSLNMSAKSQQQANAMIGKGLRAYLTYVKWATIIMVILVLLGIAAVFIVGMQRQ